MQSDGVNEGIAAYKRYCDYVGGRTWDDRPIPEWNQLTEKIRGGWIAAATTPSPILEFDTRENLQIMHAKEYARKYAGAGVSGHGQFMLIAKLAATLGL